MPFGRVKSVVSFLTVNVISRTSNGICELGSGVASTICPGPSAVMPSTDTGILDGPPCSRSLRSDQTTSSEVTGVPSWKVAPSARVNRQRLPSASGSHAVARRAATVGFAAGTVSGS